MKIGVVSDTHSLKIPRQLVDEFKKVDLILHAGDLCTKSDLIQFQEIQKTVAVMGNMDDLNLNSIIANKQIIKADGLFIGLFHGFGPPLKVLESAQKEFKNDKVDIVIFGHSHQPFNEKIGKVLFFNPGSPNDKVRAPYCSYGILEINDKQVKAKIVKVKD